MVNTLPRALLLALGVLSASPAAAQPYPSKSIRMIAPYPPGGSSDVLARIVAQKLTGTLGRQMVVDNRPGATGNIGHELAARAPADGYTLLLSSSSSLVTNRFLFKHLGFDPLNDFAPISLVATAAPMLVVNPAVPARNVAELIALAKAKPDQLTFGSGGVGTTSHIVGEVFKSATGVRIVHVPYKGGVLAVTDLVGGQITMSFADMVPSVPQVKAGRLRALAVSSEVRSPALPEVPTMPEAGVDAKFPGQWWAIIAPKGTPAAIIKRINSDTAKFMQMPDVQERLASMGTFPQHSTPERVTETMTLGAQQMSKVVKAAGIQAE